MTTIYKFLYLLSALVPVHIVAALALSRDEMWCWFSGAVLLAILGVLATVFLTHQYVTSHSGDSLRVIDVQSVESEVFAFLAIFIPFVIGLDLRQDMILTGALFFYLSGAVIFLRMDGLVPNALLLIVGWRPLRARIQLDGKSVQALIFSNQQPMIDPGSIELKRIGSSRTYIHVRR